MGKLGVAVPDATAVMAELADDGSAVNGPEDLPDWDAINWRHQEEQVRRLQQRIFKKATVNRFATCRNCCCAAGLTRWSACAGSRSITLAAVPPASTGRSR
jgi:hypothetical protein